MRAAGGFALLLLAALEAGAQTTTRVRWDRNVDFTGYSTFAWMEGRSAELPEIHDLIVEVTEDELSVRGILPQDANPDLYVAYYASTREEFQIRGGYRADWEDPGTLTVESYVAGTLVIDLVDAAENRVVWRASVSAVLSGNPRRDAPRIRAVVERMFAGFPPQP